MPDYPKRGHGRRYLDCEMYDACLALAAAERWEGFHCEGCPELEAHDEAEAKASDPFKGGSFLVGQKKEATMQDKNPRKLCETCGKKPVIHPNSKECASCMAKRAHHKKKEKAPRGRPKKTPPKQPSRTGVKDYMDRMEAGAEPVITVHFDQHREILVEISRLAEEETRTLELQTIHLLKKGLRAG